MCRVCPTKPRRLFRQVEIDWSYINAGKPAAAESAISKGEVDCAAAVRKKVSKGAATSHALDELAEEDGAAAWPDGMDENCDVIIAAELPDALRAPARQAPPERPRPFFEDERIFDTIKSLSRSRRVL